MPLGLHHLIGGDHYAPMPENPDPRRADWSAIYYHRADASGIGFDRTRARQRRRRPVPLAAARAVERSGDHCPSELLLWFHRLPWDYRMKSGRTLWDELVAALHARRGARRARSRRAGRRCAGKVDDERYRAVLAKLRRQADDAAAWRDKCLRYFAGVGRQVVP